MKYEKYIETDTLQSLQTKVMKNLINGLTIIGVENDDFGLLASTIGESGEAAPTGVSLIGGVYNLAAPTFTDGDLAALQLDVNGKLMTSSSSSSGVSGGGLPLYVLSPTGSMNHGTTAYTAATQFTIAGYSFTPEAQLISKIERYDTTGALQETFTPEDTLITIAGAVYTVTGMAAAATDTFVLYQLGPEKTLDIANDLQKNSRQNPDWAKYTNNAINVDTTNVAAVATYFPSATGMSMDGSRHFSVSGQLIDVGTVLFHVEMMNDEDTTSGNWQQVYGYDDINNITTNAWSVTNSTTELAISFNNCNYNHVRLVVTPDNATNTVILKGRKLF